MNNWPKKITVDKRIVSILSVATYENFPKAIKEIITNSYDADATNVDITIEPENENIIVKDNGHGIDEDDFDFYLRIAYRERDKKNSTLNGRKIIGKFGVGFLSVFPFCLNYEIESTKKGSPDIMYAKIPTSKYFSIDRKLIDVSDIFINGGKRYSPSKINEQYTIIRLQGFSNLTLEFFKQKNIEHSFSVFNYKPIDRLIWELSEDLPVDYENKNFNEIFDYNKKFPFEVKVNGEDVHRKVYGNTILAKNKTGYDEVGDIKYKYFISTNYNPIQPPEARGLKIRNLNVGVGPRDFFGVGIEGRTYASQSNITGEIHIWDGLNDLISLRRDDFNYSKDFEELKATFRRIIRYWADTIYDVGDLQRSAKETANSYRLTNLNLLDPQKITDKISSLAKKGFTVKNTDEDNEVRIEHTLPIQINKAQKEIIVSKDFGLFEKKVEINDKIYSIKMDKWDYSKEKLYPACKFDGNKILINKDYPLFKGRKYLDVFFKLYSLLLIEYKEKKISKESYQLLLEDITKLFNNYI